MPKLHIKQVNLFRSVLLLMVLTSLVICQAKAEAPVWLRQAIKSKNPNQLAYRATVDNGCPLDELGAREVIDGIFIRSRIKPLKGDTDVKGSIYLSIGVSCFADMQIETENTQMRANLADLRKALRTQIVHGDITVQEATDSYNRALDRAESKIRHIPPTYHLKIFYGRKHPSAPMLFDYDFSYFGIGDRNNLISTLKTGVEEAVTVYLQANFDL